MYSLSSFSINNGNILLICPKEESIPLSLNDWTLLILGSFHEARAKMSQKSFYQHC